MSIVISAVAVNFSVRLVYVFVFKVHLVFVGL